MSKSASSLPVPFRSLVPALSLLPVVALAVACGGSSDDGSSEPPTEVASPATPGAPAGSSAPSAPSTIVDGGPETATSTTPNVPVDGGPVATPACGAMPTVPTLAVRPRFLVVDRTKGVAPPAMTGGALQGKYAVRAATVYLPEAAALVARPETSRGDVKAGFAFVGRGFRMQLAGDITVDTLLGPQTRATSLDGEGTFSSSGGKFVADSTCAALPPIQGEITYTARPDGATFLLKTTELNQEVTIALEAEVVR